MNGLVGGFLPAWYAMKKDKGFVAFECMLFVLLFALLISLCARAGGRFCRVVIEAPIQLGTAPGSGGS